MEKTNIKPDEQEPDEWFETTDQDEGSEDTNHDSHRKRKRIKVRRRIRIKKRTNPKKKAKKTMENIAWVVIVAAFLATLIILVLQLDLNDKRTKKSMGKSVSMIENSVDGLRLPIDGCCADQNVNRKL